MMENDLTEFCLKWNNHHNTLISVLDSLLSKERLVDVTLAAEGQFINVHRIVLFACSQYFEELLSQLPDKQAVVFLKDVKFADLKALVNYMYRGEVNVSQDRLEMFLHTADALKIKGLVDQQQRKKFKTSFGEELPLKVKAKINGPKASQILLEPHPTSGNKNDFVHYQQDARLFSSPPIEMIEPPFNNNEEENEQEQCLRERGSEEDDDLEPGVMVAEMEPDDNFISVLADQSENIDSEFGDDHFEATENWSSQHVEDEYWNNSQEKLDTLLAITNSSDGSDTWTSTPNETAGPSRHKRAKTKASSSKASLSPSTAKRGRGRAQAVRNSKYYLTKPYSCPQCQRRYIRKDNLQAHIRYECGQDPQFSCPVCQHKFSHRRYIQKHMMRRHPTEYEDFQTTAQSESTLS